MLFKVILLLAVVLCAVAKPAVTIVANVRGKKYEISAETVGEFSQKVETVSGLTASEQSVLFRGKVLNAKDSLESLGVSSGDVLNVLKGRKVRAPTPSKLEPLPTPSKAVKAPKSVVSPTSSQDALGMDPEKMQEMMRNMDPAKLKESMEAMEKLMNSNVLDEFFGDEEKLEEARLSMLEKADEYDKMMPGFKQQMLPVAADRQKWKEAMLATKEQLMQAKKLYGKQGGGAGAGGAKETKSLPRKPDTR